MNYINYISIFKANYNNYICILKFIFKCFLNKNKTFFSICQSSSFWAPGQVKNWSTCTHLTAPI